MGNNRKKFKHGIYGYTNGKCKCDICNGAIIKHRNVATVKQHRDDWHRLRMYGITAAEYASLQIQQNGLCAICGKPETVKRNGKIKALAIDHDHTTGRIRGLLCNRCNRGLGCFSDDAKRLFAASVYLADVTVEEYSI